MYFAGNAVCTSIVSAISGSLIYESIKNLFICKGQWGVQWATGKDALVNAAAAFGADPSNVFNLGTLLVPFIVAGCCILGAILARKMPRDYTPERVGKELKELDPSVDLSVIETDERYHEKEEKGEIIFVQIGLSILSGFIFGFIWLAFLFKSVNEFAGKKLKSWLWWLGSCLVPFFSIFTIVKMANKLGLAAKEKGVDFSKSALIIPSVILTFFFPILPINVVALALLQRNVNKLYAAEQMVENQEETLEKVEA